MKFLLLLGVKRIEDLPCFLSIAQKDRPWLASKMEVATNLEKQHIRLLEGRIIGLGVKIEPPTVMDSGARFVGRQGTLEKPVLSYMERRVC